MAQKFIVAACQGADPPPTTFNAHDDALTQTRSLFDEHGIDIEIAIYINWISPGAVWLGPEILRDWYRAGCPPVR